MLRNKLVAFTTTFIVVFVALCVYAAGGMDTLSSFNLHTPTQTSIQCTVAWTQADDNPDSVALVGFVGASTDTTWFGYLNSVNATSDTLTGLIPGTKYIVFPIPIGTQRGAVKKDTLYTKVPKLEDFRRRSEFKEMKGARSTDSNNHDSLYVTGASGLDSTMCYWNAPYTSIQVYVDGNADSVNTKVLVYPGYTRETLTESDDTQLSTWAYNFAAVDSFMLTQSGWSAPERIYYDPCAHFYLRFDGGTGEGKNKYYPLIFRRW